MCHISLAYRQTLVFESECFFLFVFFNYCHTAYKDIQYTTLLTLLKLLTTQYYITFSFPFAHTVREKKRKGKKLLTTFVLKVL